MSVIIPASRWPMRWPIEGDLPAGRTAGDCRSAWDKTLPGRWLSGLLLESEGFCLALYGARGYLDGVPGAGALLLYSF
jgi:hypothetical protein